MNDEKQALIKELMDLGIVEVANPEGKLQSELWTNLVVKDVD